jgi:hypothetical protein
VKAAEPVTAGEPGPAPAAAPEPLEPASAGAANGEAPAPNAEPAAYDTGSAASDTEPAAPAPPAPSEPDPAVPRRGRLRAPAVSLLAWLLPGFGHLVLGLWLRGLAFGLLVGATAAVGVALRGRLYWFGYGVSAAPIDAATSPESPLLVAAASVVSIGLGLPAAALRWVTGYQGDVTAPGYEYGTAFLLTAGLMNLLLVFDAWDEARR